MNDILAWLPGIAAVMVAFVGGCGLGIIHFRLLRDIAKRLVEGKVSAVALQVARLLVLGVLLWWAAQWGAHVLLAAFAGILLGRSRVLAGERA